MENYDVDLLLLRKAELDLRALVKELFLARRWRVDKVSAGTLTTLQLVIRKERVDTSEGACWYSNKRVGIPN